MPPPPPTPEEPRGADSGSAGGAVLPLAPGLGRRPARTRPLPDAAAVRLLRVPDSAPPYDDGFAEAGPGGRPRPRARAPQPAARPAQPGPGGTTTQRAPAPGTPGRSSRPAAVRATAADARWPSQFAQVLAETLAGSRPQGQIRPWTTDQARRRIRQLGPSLAAEAQPRVRRIVTSRPATGVVEMTVVVGFGPRIRALAVRLEREAGARPRCDTGRDGPPGPDAAAARWICTAVEAA